MSEQDPDALREQIAALTRKYFEAAFRQQPFVPGESPVPVSGKLISAADLQHAVDASLDGWLTTGRFAAEFERQFARACEVRHALLTNSGSSANLLAVSALTSPLLGERRLRPGDEVITLAAGFPTTVNPILQNGLVPVFIDVELGTYGPLVAALEEALSERTRAIIFAHTLGNPFDLAAVGEFARKHELFLVEDCCDALGSTFDGRQVGTFGELATVSFYPAHHITMGEGGAVLTRLPLLKRIVESFRDWGRDCWCDPGRDNTCGKRFGWQLGTLPCGYDHKYTYSHVGYNLKVTDMQAAIGLSQLQRLPEFIAARKRNFALLRSALADLENEFLLPEATPGSDPSWFGFPLGIRPESGVDRRELQEFLDARRIGSRLLFAGNLVHQPAYAEAKYRVAGSLENSDFVMNQVFWVGVYPGLSEAMIEYLADSLRLAVHTLAARHAS